MSSRRVAAVGSRAFRVEEKLFEGWRGCVCVGVCDESSLVDGEGAVSGVVLWMICVDV
jgi:hypothetical protein